MLASISFFNAKNFIQRRIQLFYGICKYVTFMFSFFFVVGLAIDYYEWRTIWNSWYKPKIAKGVLKWIVDKFMKPMRYSKKLIGRSIEKNSVILFFLSILVLAFYYLFVGLLFLYFKSMIYEVIGMTPGVDFIEAFALLFGSGIQAFLLWIKKLKEKSKSEENKDMNIWQSYGVLFSLALWAYSLFIFWVFSPESFFYTQSGGISIFSKAISLFMGFFMIYVLVCLLDMRCPIRGSWCLISFQYALSLSLHNRILLSKINAVFINFFYFQPFTVNPH